MGIIYFFIAICSTIVGSMAGLGGGVIIKPVLDTLGGVSTSDISVLSSTTVLAMAIVTIISQLRNKNEFKFKKTIYIGIGSIFGGIIGQKLLKISLTYLNHNTYSIIQNGLLAVLLIIVFIYMNNKSKFKSYKIESLIACLIIGVILGTISSFLSIGGGPINVFVLTMMFSMPTKEAAINSVVTILFSQVSKVTTIAISSGIVVFQLPALPYMIIGGILGGFIGSRLNKKTNDKTVLKVFNVVLVLLILLTFYNILGNK